MRTKKFHLLGFIFILAVSNLKAQDPDAKSGESHVAVPTFGEATGGYITIGEHLEDSLMFSDPWFNERFRIVSFNLALKCNGNTIKYMENKSGNRLTSEMKAEVMKLHSNCSISFDGIKMLSREKDNTGKYTETKLKAFQLKLK